ncbi:MAG: phage portal protein family protein [Desulfobaccales bacterium]
MGLKDLFGRMFKPQAKPETRELAAVSLAERWSTYPSAGLTPERLAEIFRLADQGDICRQMELFEEMEEKDAHLASLLQTRKLAVLSLDYEVLPYAKNPEDEDIAGFVREVLQALPDVEGALLDLLDAIGKGFALAEIIWEVAGAQARAVELRWIPQKRVTFVTDLKPRLLTPEAPWQGVEPPPWKVIYHRFKARSGHAPRAGVLRVVAWMYLLKNYALKDWAGFNEVFGMPLRLGKYDPTASAADREALIRAIRSLGSDAAGVISKSTEIEFVEAASRLSGTNPYQVLAEFCNREMSKAILGQTLTTDTAGATGTYSAARVHAEVRRDLVEADAQMLAVTLREQLLRPLVGFNFGWDRPCPWFRFKLTEEEDLKTLSEVYRNLKEIGVPLRGDQVAERFGISLPPGGASQNTEGGM